jgi:hypothetical protein
MIIVEHLKRVNESFSINFIDENGLYIGWDDYQSCCEWSGWFLSDSATTTLDEADELRLIDEEPDLKDFIFVPPALMGEAVKPDVVDSGINKGGHVQFEVLHMEKGTKYLHFFNSQNGYYGHEILFSTKDSEIFSDYL